MKKIALVLSLQLNQKKCIFVRQPLFFHMQHKCFTHFYLVTWYAKSYTFFGGVGGQHGLACEIIDP